MDGETNMETKQPKNKAQSVQMKSGEAIDLPKIDVLKYVGKSALIEKVETMMGEFGLFLRVSTQVVDVPVKLDGSPLLNKNNEPVEIRGSKTYPLIDAGQGHYNWGKASKLADLLSTHKVHKPEDLVGKKVVLQATDEKNGTRFLTFA